MHNRIEQLVKVASEQGESKRKRVAGALTATTAGALVGGLAGERMVAQRANRLKRKGEKSFHQSVTLHANNRNPRRVQQLTARGATLDSGAKQLRSKAYGKGALAGSALAASALALANQYHKRKQKQKASA